MFVDWIARYQLLTADNSETNTAFKISIIQNSVQSAVAALSVQVRNTLHSEIQI